MTGGRCWNSGGSSAPSIPVHVIDRPAEARRSDLPLVLEGEVADGTLSHSLLSYSFSTVTASISLSLAGIELHSSTIIFRTLDISGILPCTCLAFHVVFHRMECQKTRHSD